MPRCVATPDHLRGPRVPCPPGPDERTSSRHATVDTVRRRDGRAGAGRLAAAGPARLAAPAQGLMSVAASMMPRRDMRTIAAAAAGEVAREDAHRVVVTHGTDTMEETGYLLDLVHDSEKPVLLTG